MERERLVYSTESGRIETPRPAKQSAGNPPSDGIVRVSRERGGRGGKTVTVVRGIPLRGSALQSLAADLRRYCGAGGTIREGAIELQGDHRERLAGRLQALGYRVKLSGG